MGRDVCEGSRAAREVFQTADAALGEPLSQLCFDGPLEALTLTANTQPAVLAASMAIVAALRERFEALPAPACAAGHSLGEYSALVAAGALQLEAAVRICRLRGRAMQDAVPAGQGAMSAIMGIDGVAVSEACEQAAQAGEVVSPANFNAPAQTVIAGHSAAVGRASVLARAKGAKVIPLKVSAPFHCALMASARSSLASALEGECIEGPRFPVLANVDAEAKPGPDDIRRALIEQVDRPVQWLATVQRMADMGITHALELGPGRVLAGLVKRCARTIRVLSVDSAGSIEKVPEFLNLGSETGCSS